MNPGQRMWSLCMNDPFQGIIGDVGDKGLQGDMGDTGSGGEKVS